MKLNEVHTGVSSYHLFARIFVACVTLFALVWLPWWVPLILAAIAMVLFGAYELVLVGPLLDVLYPAAMWDIGMLFTAVACALLSVSLLCRPLLRNVV